MAASRRAGGGSMSTPAHRTPEEQRQLFLDKAASERVLAVSDVPDQKANHLSVAAQYEAWANDAEYCLMVANQSSESDDER